MRDLEHWKDKVELQLDGRQIFFLFFGSALCACLIFVVGVMVGKRIEARAIQRAQAPASDPLAALDELGNAEEGLTFHSALADRDKAPPRREGKGDKGEAATRTEDPAVKGRDKAAQGAAAQSALKAQAALAQTEKKPDPKPEKPLQAAQAEKKPAAPKEGKEAAREAARGKGQFTLQLSAFATKGEAVEFMRKLRDTGYKPFMVESVVPGKGLMYRVRLGEYATRESALSAKTEFERRQKMVAYVAKL